MDTLGEEKNDLYAAMGGTVSFFNYKMIFFIFVFFMFLSSDVFQSTILSNFTGAIVGGELQTWGIVLQGIFLVLGYVILDILIRQGVI
jgi:hypothetical protein